MFSALVSGLGQGSPAGPTPAVNVTLGHPGTLPGLSVSSARWVLSSLPSGCCPWTGRGEGQEGLTASAWGGQGRLWRRGWCWERRGHGAGSGAEEDSGTSRAGDRGRGTADMGSWPARAHLSPLTKGLHQETQVFAHLRAMAHTVSSTGDVPLCFPLMNSYSPFKAQLTHYLTCLSDRGSEHQLCAGHRAQSARAPGCAPSGTSSCSCHATVPCTVRVSRWPGLSWTRWVWRSSRQH